jgi:hypothetical protein
MLKKALQEESIEAIETRSGTRENSLQLMTTRILSFVCFPSPPLQSLKKDKIISTIQELEFNYLIVSGGLRACL